MHRNVHGGRRPPLQLLVPALPASRLQPELVPCVPRDVGRLGRRTRHPGAPGHRGQLDKQADQGEEHVLDPERRRRDVAANNEERFECANLEFLSERV